MDIESPSNVQLVDYMGSDITVVDAARVSFNKKSDMIQKDNGEWDLSDKDKKLIKYLADNNHWTPFAHPTITLRITAPLAIRTQFFKHKVGFVENEISGRYVELDEPSFYFPKWRGRSTTNKQGSSDFLSCDDEADAHDITKDLTNDCRYAYDCAFRVYKRLLDQGVAPEQARFVLPQGTYTTWFWTGSLSAYARFYNQRSHKNAQWEIRQYASQIGAIMNDLFPVSWEFLTKVSS